MFHSAKYILITLCFIFLACPGWAQQEFDKVPEDVLQGQIAAPKPKINNLPFNIYGLSGMMVTSSTHTLEPGSFEVGAAALWEDSDVPEYYRREYSFLFNVGIPGGLEFALKVPWVMTNLKVKSHFNLVGAKVRNFDTQDMSNLGGLEGTFKWGFLKQKNFLPAFAVALGGIAPTGEYTRDVEEKYSGGREETTEYRTGDVKYYGFKVMLAMGLELNDLAFTDYAFAIMADGTMVFRDVGVDDRAYEEKSGLVHAGVIFPLHPRNFVELMLEYEGELMRGTTNEQDINSVLLSLRGVTSHFNVSLGAKYNFKEDPLYDDTFLWMGTFSYTYF